MSWPPVYTTRWIITCRSCGRELKEVRGRGRWTKKGPQLPPGEPEVIRRTVVHKALCVDCWTASQQLEAQFETSHGATTEKQSCTTADRVTHVRSCDAMTCRNTRPPSPN